MRPLLTLLLLCATTVLAGSPGGPYLGQRPPGLEPELFAPGVVCTGLHERDLLIHPDGRTIWYCVSARQLNTVFETRLVDGRWTEPMQAPFHADRAFACFEPTLSADGQRVLFLTNRAAPGQEQGAGWANQNIFECRRQPDESWGEATALPPPITSDDGEYFFFSSNRVTVDQPAADEPMTQGDLLAAHGEPGGGSMDIWWVDARVLDRWRP